MSNYATCKRCGRPLCGDDIPLYRKMVARNATDFLCMDCLAAYCSTTRAELEKYVVYLRESGLCALFPKSNEA